MRRGACGRLAAASELGGARRGIVQQTHAKAPAARERWILWAALLVSQLVYLGILLSGMAPGDGGGPAILPLLLGAIGVGEAALAHLFWRRASGSGRAAHEPPPEPASAFTSSVLAWTLDESVAISALVLGFLGFPAATWGLFSGAAFVLMLVHRPG